MADCEPTDSGKYQHVYEARWGRTEITDADGREGAYRTQTLEELDALVPRA